MQLTIEITEQDLLDFGHQAIQKEMQSTLKWLRMRNRLEQMADEIRNVYKEPEYQKTLEQIRAEAWQEYKQGLGL